MFSDVHLKNFGPFSDFRWSEHGCVNVVVGENDTGKSYLLRLMYVFAKNVEDVAARQPRGPEEHENAASAKLRWTFQPYTGIGALIRDGAQSLRVEAKLAGETYAFGVSKKSATWVLAKGFDQKPAAEVSTVFLPPKEVLTTFAAIEISRSKFEIYGFDDTYYDLLKLLRVPPTQGEVMPELRGIADELERFIGGRIVRNGVLDEFLFMRGKRAYGMPQTADGIKKLGTLANLLRNRSIKPGTILFVDEPETNLHPRATSVLTTMLFRLGQAGVQVYLATHSYFVLKQFEILAKQHDTTVPFCSLVRRGVEIEANFADLREGMPDSPIIDESNRLFELGFNVDVQSARMAQARAMRTANILAKGGMRKSGQG